MEEAVTVPADDNAALAPLIDPAAQLRCIGSGYQFKDHLLFEGYDQERWVEFQDYQHVDWQELLTLWRGYNLLIARVMELTPAAVRTAPRSKHNLHQTALVAIPENEPATLEYFMLDYIKHLEQHLRQIV